MVWCPVPCRFTARTVDIRRMRTGMLAVILFAVGGEASPLSSSVRALSAIVWNHACVARPDDARAVCWSGRADVVGVNRNAHRVTRLEPIWPQHIWRWDRLGRTPWISQTPVSTLITKILTYIYLSISHTCVPWYGIASLFVLFYHPGCSIHTILGDHLILNSLSL